jgi:glycosyltransferase domain-containing protein
MKDRCTIVIPTHNRPHYLERCVRWFAALGMPIVVADSSAAEWRSELRGAVCYIHKPGGFEVYRQKLVAAVAEITTPFLALCADDDFITEEGLRASVDFLDAHPDYAFSQGYAYWYQTFGSRIVLWPMPYLSHDVVAESWLDRIEQAHSTVFYGVQRTEILRAGLDFLARQDFREIIDGAAGFFDFALTAHAAKSGKFKRCPVPFGLREYSPNIAVVGKRFPTITSRNIPDFYANLLAFLAGGEAAEPAKTRLLRVMASDYAGQIAFDLRPVVSRKRFLRRLPEGWVGRIEFLYRLFAAARAYAGREYFAFMKIFFRPEYARFKTFVLPRGSG